MKNFLLIFPFLILCNFSNGQDIPVPEGFLLIDWDQEDLDLDGLIDMAAVYNSTSPDKSGIHKKELILYRWNGEKWDEWVRTGGAFLPPQGELDPYRGIEIEDGFLTIRHAGKSNKNWQTVDAYQFREGIFQLVRYSHNSYILCEFLQIIELNLLKGEGVVAMIHANCEEENKKQTTRDTEEFSVETLTISLSNRFENPIIFHTPRLKAEVILSPT